ncbi:MAG: hypothetical protein CL802_02120 [Citromicrobium sp.]|nr:hypothetical protein [Citromicrobium sp.]
MRRGFLVRVLVWLRVLSCVFRGGGFESQKRHRTFTVQQSLDQRLLRLRGAFGQAGENGREPLFITIEGGIFGIALSVIDDAGSDGLAIVSFGG